MSTIGSPQNVKDAVNSKPFQAKSKRRKGRIKVLKTEYLGVPFFMGRGKKKSWKEKQKARSKRNK